MLRSLARFSGPEASDRTPSLADFITTTSGFRFSVDTIQPGVAWCIACTDYPRATLAIFLITFKP